jgi:hypothetical protein
MVQFKTVPGFGGYRVGDDGSLWSRWSLVPRPNGGGNEAVLGETWHEIRPGPTRKGHLRTRLTLRSGIRERHYVHRLILLAFVGPAPAGFQACHNDGNPVNNALSNLRWDTPTGNVRDSIKHGTFFGGKRAARPKLTAELVRSIRAAHFRDGVPIRQLARTHGLHHKTIWEAVRGLTWKSVA